MTRSGAVPVPAGSTGSTGSTGNPCADPDCTLPLYHPGRRCQKEARPAPPPEGWRTVPVWHDLFGDAGRIPWPQVAR